MKRNEIANRVLSLIEQRSIKQFTHDTTFEDLEFDSLDKVELMVDIEKEFDITLNEDLMDRVKTVEHIVDLTYNTFNGVL